MKWLWTLMLWLSLLTAPFALMAAVNGVRGAETHAQREECSRFCHDRGCPHNQVKYDWSKPIPRTARAIYFKNIEWLRSTPLGYKNTNLVVYVFGLPALFGLLLFGLLWPRRPPGRGHWATLGMVGVPVLGMGLLTLARWQTLYEWNQPSLSRAMYWYCTDFCIHGANLLNITYEEFNFALFVFGFPFTLVVLVFGIFLRLLSSRWRRESGP